MRFAAVQYDIVWEDKPSNHAIVQDMLREATGRGIVSSGDFVLLPELGDTGFSMNLQTITMGDSVGWAQILAKQFGIYLQHGFARRETERERDGDGAAVPRGRNCAVVVDPTGHVVGEYQKVHPFSYGKESLHYSGGDHLEICTCQSAKVAPMICYDLRFPELWRLAAIAGAEVFTIGASWPAARQRHWRALLIARAIENQAFVVAVNRTGSDPHLKYSGGSIIISPQGEVIAEADDRPTVLSAELDLTSLREWREHFPALRDIHRDLLGAIRVHQ
jgi:omega-amidase